ncbi:MAG: hypothetical protein ACU0BB_02225 [Paracoccaceae bacterium]
MRQPLVIALMTSFLASMSVAQDSEKLADDPTKVVTKVGLNYTDSASVSGSLAIGPVSKINARIGETGEWSLGGSYLFGFGIVNVAASKRDLSTGVQQTQYSIGSFAPIIRNPDDPTAWQVFAAFGFNYTEGELVDVPFFPADGFPITTSSKGGYLGFMGLKPLSDKWVSRGSYRRHAAATITQAMRLPVDCRIT